jgi:hypothetical protein
MGRVWFVILVLCLGVFPGGVAAQVTLEAHFGLQGAVRLDKWNLVTVHLFNAEAPLTGTLGVRVRQGSELRQDLHVTTFTQEVTLPQRSRKRFTFAVPIASTTHPVEVFLRQGDQNLAHQQLSLREAFSAEHIILGLTRDLSLDFLATTFQRHTRVAYLPPQELPPHWSAYDSVSAVVVKGVSLQSLTERQWTALHQWLARGGTLVAAGDPQYTLLQEPRLQALLPVEVLGLETLEGLPGFAERYGAPLPATRLLAVRARLRHGQVLAGTVEAPLVAQRAFGKGRVVFLAVDYATQPLLGWPGNRALWRDLLQPVEGVDFGRVFAELGLLDETHPVIKVLRRPIVSYPSHLLLSLFLLAYCSSLGLLFWRMGKRQARLKRYGVGVLLLVLGFTAWAYTIFPEHSLRRPALVIDLTTMEVLPETEYAHTHGYLGLFSARGGQYTLDFKQPETILRHTFQRGAGKAGEAIEIAATEQCAMRGMTLDPWALRVFSVESMTAAPVHVVAQRHATGLTLRVQNRTALPLQGATVMYRGKLFVLGAIAPGEELFEDVYSARRAPESKQETAWQAFYKARPTPSEPPLTYLQEVLLQQYFGDKRLAETEETLWLVGWLQAPTTLQQAPGGLPVRGMTLVVSRVPL